MKNFLAYCFGILFFAGWLSLAICWDYMLAHSNDFSFWQRTVAVIGAYLIGFYFSYRFLKQ